MQCKLWSLHSLHASPSCEDGLPSAIICCQKYTGSRAARVAAANLLQKSGGPPLKYFTCRNAEKYITRSARYKDCTSNNITETNLLCQ